MYISCHRFRQIANSCCVLYAGSHFFLLSFIHIFTYRNIHMQTRSPYFYMNKYASEHTQCTHSQQLDNLTCGASVQWQMPYSHSLTHTYIYNRRYIDSAWLAMSVRACLRVCLRMCAATTCIVPLLCVIENNEEFISLHNGFLNINVLIYEYIVSIYWYFISIFLITKNTRIPLCKTIESNL